MSSPKEDCEAIINAIIPSVELLLVKYGEFYPVGAAMNPTGEIVLVSAYDGDEHPPSLDVIRLMKQAFVQGAKDGSYIATALAHDVRITIPSTKEKSDAISDLLDHKDNYSINVMFPYKIENGKFIVGTAIAQKGETDIFGSNKQP